MNILFILKRNYILFIPMDEYSLILYFFLLILKLEVQFDLYFRYSSSFTCLKAINIIKLNFTFFFLIDRFFILEYRK